MTLMDTTTTRVRNESARQKIFAHAIAMKKKFCIVLDIDGTLIDSSARHYHVGDHAADIETPSGVSIFKRPGVDAFLDDLFLSCRAVALWTHGSSEWLDVVVNRVLVDTDGRPRPWAFTWDYRRATHESPKCSYSSQFGLSGSDHYGLRRDPIKKLKKVWNNKTIATKGFVRQQTLIVEDTRSNCVRNFGNAIYVPSFEVELSRFDDCLPRLARYILWLQSTTSDRVRAIEKRWWSTMDLEEEDEECDADGLAPGRVLLPRDDGSDDDSSDDDDDDESCTPSERVCVCPTCLAWFDLPRACRARLPRPLIFLDVDGVLNTHTMQFDDDDDTILSCQALGPNAPAPLSKRRLERLAALVSRVDAHVVLSTTWRVVEAPRRILTRVLAEYGIGEERLRGSTRELPRATARHGAAGGRAVEICAWLREDEEAWAASASLADSHHRHSPPWVALDDLRLAAADEAMRGHAVRTDPAAGLLEEDCEEACLLLARQLHRLSATLAPPRKASVWGSIGAVEGSQLG